jgi:hypothetical protein
MSTRTGKGKKRKRFKRDNPEQWRRFIEAAKKLAVGKRYSADEFEKLMGGLLPPKKRGSS